ncbi:hypothetical protein [Rhodoplanes sp. SY1]|uniref:hypothetical protein n=1 Tax=Rhodoplanes sp. SY1 TaxID=3166646 RepID=UPI0038B5A447
MADQTLKISASMMQAATGASRGEVILWSRLGHLRLPAIDEGKGKSRFYSLGNLIEMAVHKRLDGAGVPHVVAADFIERRFRLAATQRGYFEADADRSIVDFANDPRPWLTDSEFDPCAPPYFEGAENLEGRAFWSYGGGLRSLHDDYLRHREWAPVYAEQRARLNVPPGYGPQPDSEKHLAALVFDAVSDGETVIEIRGAIRRALCFAFGATFWPGQFPAARVISDPPVVPVLGPSDAGNDDETEGGWTGNTENGNE